MEEKVINILSHIGKVGTVTFGIISSVNVARVLWVFNEEILTADQLWSRKNEYLGKVVKVEGEATGETYLVIVKQSFKDQEKVVYSVHKESFNSLWSSPNYSSKIVMAKQGKIVLKGETKSIDLFIDSNTVVEGEVIYKAKKNDKVEGKDLLKSIIHLTLMWFSRTISRSFRQTRTCAEEVIRPGAEIVAKGVLQQKHNSLYIRPETIMHNKDISLLKAAKSLKISLKLMVFFSVIWAGTTLYRKARNGSYKLFSKHAAKEEPSEFNECIICLTNSRNIIINPCKHMAICSNCTNVDKCPICRVHIDSFDQITFLRQFNKNK